MAKKEAPEYCRKEATIAKLESELATLKKIIMGNGQEGLATSVPKLAQSVDDLNMNVHSLTRGVNGLLRFQAELSGNEDGKETVRKRNRWLITIIVTLLVGLSGILIGIHFGS